jgi:hypothetical protein
LRSNEASPNGLAFLFGTSGKPSRLIKRCHTRDGRGVLLLTTLKPDRFAGGD